MPGHRKIQPIRMQEGRCILDGITPQPSHQAPRMSHGYFWPLYFVWHGIKQLCNALLWYTKEYPIRHLHVIGLHTYERLGESVC